MARWGRAWCLASYGAYWHVPLVWINGAYQESASPLMYMLVFTMTILPISVLFTWLYTHTKGSVLLASVFHVAINVTESALIIEHRNGQQLLLTALALNTVLATVARLPRWQHASSAR
jgi:membrane protease YdiL (CAAX protease family)